MLSVGISCKSKEMYHALWFGLILEKQAYERKLRNLSDYFCGWDWALNGEGSFMESY